MNRSAFSHTGLAKIGWHLIYWDTILSLGLGLLTALVGGALTPLGDGLGGGYGIPELLFLVAILLGLPGLFRGIGGLFKWDWEQAMWVIVFIGPLIIAVGYILIPHALDPCVNAIWDLTSQIGDSIPLCQRFDNDLNVHTRFHYVWHILPTLPLVWLYRKMLEKRRPEVVREKMKQAK